jgi:hypothetical protein
MNAEELENEIAKTMHDTPRESWETKTEYQKRAKQLTYERLDKARPASASIRQVRQCIYCHKAMGDKPGVAIDIGGGLHMVAHSSCYDRMTEAGSVKTAPKPVRILHKAAPGELRDVIQKAVHQVVTNHDIWHDPIEHNAHGLYFAAPGEECQTVYRSEHGGQVCVRCPDTASAITK